MDAERCWAAGDQVTLRYLTRDGRPGMAWPFIVVRDTPDLVALFIPANATYKRWGIAADGTRALVDAAWRDDVLRLMFPAAATPSGSSGASSMANAASPTTTSTWKSRSAAPKSASIRTTTRSMSSSSRTRPRGAGRTTRSSPRAPPAASSGPNSPRPASRSRDRHQAPRTARIAVLRRLGDVAAGPRLAHASPLRPMGHRPRRPLGTRRLGLREPPSLSAEC